MLAAVGTFSTSAPRYARPADVVELLQRGERLRHRDHVRRLAVGDELHDVRVDEPVRVAVEVSFADDVADLVRRFVVEQ
jgi:hypothetical protein